MAREIVDLAGLLDVSDDRKVGWDGLVRVDRKVGWDGLLRVDRKVGWDGLLYVDGKVGWDGLIGHGVVGADVGPPPTEVRFMAQYLPEGVYPRLAMSSPCLLQRTSIARTWRHSTTIYGQSNLLFLQKR